MNRRFHIWGAIKTFFFLIKTELWIVGVVGGGRAEEECNTLAARGLEELFFQLWFCVSFWFWREIGFGFTYLCT